MVGDFIRSVYYYLGLIVLFVLLFSPLSIFADTKVFLKSATIITKEVALEIGGERGLIFDSGGPPYWTPSLMEVELIENKILAFLKTSPDKRTSDIVDKLSKYGRQYVGITMPGKGPVILVNAFCSFRGVAEEELKNTYISVSDGGTCYFNVRFDPRSSTFFDLYINGEA